MLEQLEIPSEVRIHIEDFIGRNYLADIARLNVSLAKKGRSSANLCVDMVPVPYTGNPFGVPREGGIALIGINPRWPKGGWASHHGINEHMPLRNCVERYRNGDPEAAAEFLDLRHGYFNDDSRLYYAPYFSKLGNRLREQWFPQLGMRQVFRERIIKADILPYFSNDADSIDTRRLLSANDDDPALVSYRRALASILADRRPRWIQCNGFASGATLENLFGVAPFTERIVIDERGRKFRLRVGRVRIGDSSRSSEYRVLIHGFTNSSSGPQDTTAWRAIANDWLKWHEDRSLVTFE